MLLFEKSTWYFFREGWNREQHFQEAKDNAQQMIDNYKQMGREVPNV